MRGYVINANIAACADAAKLLDHDAVISHLSSLTKARASSAANAGKEVCERGLCEKLERTYLLPYQYRHEPRARDRGAFNSDRFRSRRAGASKT